LEAVMVERSFTSVLSNVRLQSFRYALLLSAPPLRPLTCVRGKKSVKLHEPRGGERGEGASCSGRYRVMRVAESAAIGPALHTLCHHHQTSKKHKIRIVRVTLTAYDVLI